MKAQWFCKWCQRGGHIDLKPNGETWGALATRILECHARTVARPLPLDYFSVLINPPADGRADIILLAPEDTYALELTIEGPARGIAEGGPIFWVTHVQ